MKNSAKLKSLTLVFYWNKLLCYSYVKPNTFLWSALFKGWGICCGKAGATESHSSSQANTYWQHLSELGCAFCPPHKMTTLSFLLAAIIIKEEVKTSFSNWVGCYYRERESKINSIAADFLKDLKSNLKNLFYLLKIYVLKFSSSLSGCYLRAVMV